MIRHVVMWKLKAEDAAEKQRQASEIARRLNALVGVVPEIVSLSAGANGLYPEANWDAVLVSDFASAEDLEAYKAHPAHVAAGEYIQSVASDRVAVDFEV